MKKQLINYILNEVPVPGSHFPFTGLISCQRVSLSRTDIDYSAAAVSLAFNSVDKFINSLRALTHDPEGSISITEGDTILTDFSFLKIFDSVLTASFKLSFRFDEDDLLICEFVSHSYNIINYGD